MKRKKFKEIGMFIKKYIMLAGVLIFVLTACTKQTTELSSDVSSNEESILQTSEISSADNSDAESSLTEATAAAEDNIFRIVTTTFPVYDWVRNIVGENASGVEVILLNDEGQDYHLFKPDETDINLIANSDLFFCIGGISEEWAYGLEERFTSESEAVENDAIKDTSSLGTTDSKTCEDDTADVPVMVYLLDELRDHAIKLTPMDEEDNDDGLYEDDIASFDEHIWLAPLNAYDMCSVITDYLKYADEEHSDLYDSHSKEYMDALYELDNAYRDASDTASCKTLIVADRYPFRYLADTYLFEAVSLLKQCPSDESEVPAEIRDMIVNMMKSNNYKRILTDSDSDETFYTVITNELTDRAIELVPLRSMHRVSLKEAEAGLSYISVMQENLDLLCRIIGYE